MVKKSQYNDFFAKSMMIFSSKLICPCSMPVHKSYMHIFSRNGTIQWTNTGVDVCQKKKKLIFTLTNIVKYEYVMPVNWGGMSSTTHWKENILLKLYIKSTIFNLWTVTIMSQC